MGRHARVPPVLMRGVFRLEEARRAGLRRWHLEGKSWRRVGPGTYMWAGLTETPQLRLMGARSRLPPAAAFSGLTAAWLHGLDVMPCDPIEVTLPNDAGISARSGVIIRRSQVIEAEIVIRRGLRVTSIVRTLLDVCRRLSLVEAVVVADAALHLRLVGLDALNEAVAGFARQPGVNKLRRVVACVEPATESPMETRLRMLLLLAGLPRPEAQVAIHDSAGRFAGRLDLYYRSNRLGIEYDGGMHRESLAADNRRQNRLLDAGDVLLRFTASDVIGAPQSVANLVRRALGA